jgi:hypothetical protein
VRLIPAFGTWFALAVLMSANGVFREAVLAPAFWREVADALSAGSGIALILGVTALAFRRWGGGGLSAAPLAVMWGVLTVGFEFAVGLTVGERTVEELLENYAIWRGNLWPLVLLSLLIAPFLWTRVWPQHEGSRDG